MPAKGVAELVHDALLHAPPRVEEALLDGGSWHSEEGRDVSQRAVGRVEKRDDDPFALGQSRDLRVDKVAEFVRLGHAARLRVLVLRAERFVKRHGRQFAAANDAVGILGHDAAQPMRKRGWFAQHGQVAMRLQKCFLGHILGQVGVGQSSVGGREGQILVPPDELGERFDVTALGGSYDVLQLVHKGHFHRQSPRLRR